MGIAKDRAFHTEEIRKIYEKTGNLMGKAEESTEACGNSPTACRACSVLESGLPSPGLRAAASELSSSLPKTKGTYTDYASHLKADLQRISGKISLGGCRDRKESFRSRIRYGKKAVKGRKSLRNLSWEKSSRGATMHLRKKIKDLGMKWKKKEDEDLDKRISKALAAFKGRDREYMQQSADP